MPGRVLPHTSATTIGWTSAVRTITRSPTATTRHLPNGSLRPTSSDRAVKTVNLSDVTFDEAEERAVVEVLRSGWVSSGAVTQAFEREFAAFVGAPHAVAVSNCTAALHLALLALGVGPGDEVL